MGKISKPFSRGLRYLPRYRSNSCLNCGNPLELSHRYCPNCSQLNSTKSLTVRDFLEEFLGSIIDYDSRLFRTVTAMLIRPGQISLDYIQGKRVTYTNPFRFLLSLAIIYFLMQQMVGNYTELNYLNFSEALSEVSEDSKVTISTSANSDSIPGNRKQKDFDGFIVLLGQRMAQNDSLNLADPRKRIDSISGSSMEQYLRRTSVYLSLVRNNEKLRYEDAVEKYRLNPTSKDRFSFESAHSLHRLSKEPGTFVNVFLSRLPLVSFFFLPVFSLVPWLMYIRKKYTYTDNLIFGFHIQSLFFILLLLGLLAESITGTDFTIYAVTAFSIYLFASMRRFYKQGVFKTIVKYLILNAFFIILAGVVFLAMLLGTAVTF